MKIRVFTFIVVLLLSINYISYAGIHGELADPVFNVTTASLSNNKTLSVYIRTNYAVNGNIQINSCQLQLQEGSLWTTLSTAIPLPTITLSNNIILSATGDYSSYIGTGKYRFKLQIEADDHTKTIYSNAVTF